MLNLKKILTKVLSALTPVKTTFTPTAGSAYSAYDGCYYEKMGRLIHIHLGLSELTAGTRHTIYTLPQSIRPNTVIFAVGKSSTGMTSEITINPSGSITVVSQQAYCAVDVIFMI